MFKKEKKLTIRKANLMNRSPSMNIRKIVLTILTEEHVKFTEQE
jgi:hypothetical protein